MHLEIRGTNIHFGEYEHHLQGYALSATVEREAYRIIEEALTNARRHSRSEIVRLGLFQDSNGLRISVEDWGVGFDPAELDSSRVGLAGIRDRAKLLEGHAILTARSAKEPESLWRFLSEVHPAWKSWMCEVPLRSARSSRKTPKMPPNGQASRRWWRKSPTST